MLGPGKTGRLRNAARNDQGRLAMNQRTRQFQMRQTTNIYLGLRADPEQEERDFASEKGALEQGQGCRCSANVLW